MAHRTIVHSLLPRGRDWLSTTKILRHTGNALRTASGNRARAKLDVMLGKKLGDAAIAENSQFPQPFGAVHDIKVDRFRAMAAELGDSPV